MSAVHVFCVRPYSRGPFPEFPNLSDAKLLSKGHMIFDPDGDGDTDEEAQKPSEECLSSCRVAKR